MKVNLLILNLFFFSMASFAQEICDDGIDNDTDGLVDLNDPDCDCAGFGASTTIEGLIPNPSFEDMSCCPSSFSMLTCADDWIQASGATSDYWNTCGWSTYPGFTDAAMPLPGDPGDGGWGGFIVMSGWQEYIGACLSGTMTAGTAYVLNCWVGVADGEPDLDLTLFGTPNCADLPWVGTACPDGTGGWIELGMTSVTLAIEGEWYEVTLSFTPPVDINAVSIGGPCVPPPIPGGATYNYYYIDELTLIDSSTFAGGDIVESGNWCNGDLALTSNIDSTGWTVQWFLEGVALSGETSEVLDVMPYGAGTFSVVYTIGPDCDEAAYTLTIPDDPFADYTTANVCFPNGTNFTDNSTIGSGSITSWDWDFGEGGTSTATSPSYTYTSSGTYNVTLTVTSDQGCTDDTTIAVTVYPDPFADFEFEINGESSASGLTGGCWLNAVDFIDGSSIGSPGTITSWSWNFGDGGTSTATDPTYNYTGPGTYTITLIVTSTDGCVANFNMPIIMTAEPDITIIQNDPTCFGFSDGSFTVLVSGGSGGASATFVITDASSTVINVGGSNAVNSLVAGTYTWDVDDGGCSATGTVVIVDPLAMVIDLDITNVLCNGDLTGGVEVDTVDNHQGAWANVSYVWSSGPPGGVGITSVTGLPAGQYTLDLTDEFGCAASIDFMILEPTPLVFSEIGYEPAYCRLYDYQVGNGQIYAAATGGVPSYSYLWTEDGSVPLNTSINTTWGGLNPGSYTMVVTDANGCILTQTVALDSVNPTAIFDISSAELNGQFQGTAEVCLDAVNNSLFFANILNPIADTSFWVSFDYPNDPYTLYQNDDFFTVFDTCYDEGGEYLVCLKIQNKNGCEDEVCELITVYDALELTPPNIFTPNGDGVNDVFTFEFLQKGVLTFNCVIVNRWGVKMGEINDIYTGWDGTDRSGSQCRDGVYFYVYSGTAENGDPFEGQGTIQIVASKK
ncbi:PKD domain-containing protein [Crocinitomix catalasitica]|nr:PKD domain-containing protein [Crocinitomix catalasitica]